MGKRVGILTSGGDCAGLNAAIRAVVHRCALLGWEAIGIEDGTMGLLAPVPMVRVLHPSIFDNAMMRLGGTVLGTTNKNDPFHYPMPDGSFKDRSEEIIHAVRDKLRLDALIGIGGDGSLDILRRLARQGNLNLVGIPKTMDNDVGETEIAIGFDTAVAVATEALDRLQPTAASHDRVMVLEVMGRDAGHVALAAGIAGGADIILIPEIAYTIDALARKVREVEAQGRNFVLVIVSEAVKTPDGSRVEIRYPGGEVRYGGIGQYLGMKIAEATGAETRVTVLGHVQRGSAPTYNDRLLASALGVYAVDLVAQGKYDRMVAWKNRQVVDVGIGEAIASYQTVDGQGTLVHTARALGICLGDE